jgi:hypothetical protein
LLWQSGEGGHEETKGQKRSFCEMQMELDKRARRGVTLIEAVLFISIALGLIVGGLVFFQQASLAARTNDAVRSLSSIASETRAAYRTQDSFAGLNATVLINSGAVPSSQISGGGIVNEWNQAVTIGPSAAALPVFSGATNTGLANRFFEIVYTNVPEAACTRLVTASDGNGPIGPGIVAVRVANALVTTTPETNTSTNVTTAGGNANFNLTGAVNISPADAATACGAGDDPVDVIWTLTR